MKDRFNHKQLRLRIPVDQRYIQEAGKIANAAAIAIFNGLLEGDKRRNEQMKILHWHEISGRVVNPSTHEVKVKFPHSIKVTVSFASANYLYACDQVIMLEVIYKREDQEKREIWTWENGKLFELASVLSWFDFSDPVHHKDGRVLLATSGVLFLDVYNYCPKLFIEYGGQKYVYVTSEEERDGLSLRTLSEHAYHLVAMYKLGASQDDDSDGGER